MSTVMVKPFKLDEVRKPTGVKNVIGLSVPTRDMVHAGFAMDLAAAVGWHVTHSNDEIVTNMSYGTLLVDQRNNLVEEALKDGATHILWIDSDMRFPMTVIGDLLARDLDIVAANCSRRRPPAAFIAVDATEDGIYNVQTNPDSTGVQEVIAVGFGVMLIRSEVFEKMAKPWHRLIWNPADEKYVGEDMAFCHAARDLGYKIHIDHDLSKHILHTGIHNFGCEDIWNGTD